MRALLISCSAAAAPEKFRLARQYGLGMQMQAFYQPSILEDPEPEIARHRALVQGLEGPLTIHGAFHGLVTSAMDAAVRRTAAARIRQAHGIARVLGATDAVQHFLYSPVDLLIDGYFDRAAAFWQEILADLPAGLTMHMENTFERTPDQFVPLLEKIGAHPQLGVCLDIGHTHGLSDTPPDVWIRALGSAITYVHMHDNDSSYDQHLPLGQGTLPLEQTLDLLETYAPDALWIIEEGETLHSLAWLARHGYAPAALAALAPDDDLLPALS
jgi:sugar phosphate isomerase/epimerase